MRWYILALRGREEGIASVRVTHVGPGPRLGECVCGGLGGSRRRRGNVGSNTGHGRGRRLRLRMNLSLWLCLGLLGR